MGGITNSENSGFWPKVNKQLIKINNIDFISSHGHTIFHQPDKKITYQIGNRIELNKSTNIPVVCDFRVQDIRLGGQGAP